MLRGFTAVGWLAALAVAFSVVQAGEEQDQGEKKGAHKAAHGGCLNALGTCENGHAEVKIEGDLLKLWFVGGGTDTEKAVRIPDKEITLSVTLAGAKTAQPLALKARPNELAEEREGDCSRFEGQAGWLKGVKQFIATGTVTFKGRQQVIRIAYPTGFDPD